MKKTVEQGGDLFPSYSVSCCYQKRKALQKLEMDRDLFQGGAGKRQSWYLVFNVLIVAKKLLKDDRWVPGVVLVVDAAAVSL